MISILQLAKVSAVGFFGVWAADLTTLLVRAKERLLEEKLDVMGESSLLETGEEFLH